MSEENTVWTSEVRSYAWYAWTQGLITGAFLGFIISEIVKSF